MAHAIDWYGKPDSRPLHVTSTAFLTCCLKDGTKACRKETQCGDAHVLPKCVEPKESDPTGWAKAARTFKARLFVR